MKIIVEPPTRFERLSQFCSNVWDQRRKFVNERVVFFYLARWCQKEAGTLEPDLEPYRDEELAAVAQNVAANLRHDGERIERLVAKDGDEWTKLRRELLDSVSRLRHDLSVSVSRFVTVPTAEDFAGDALVKITMILLTGTKPSCAGCRLDGNAPGRPECALCAHERGIRGPSNEYVFQSPFTGWARTIAKNIVYDWYRSVTKKPDPLPPPDPDELSVPVPPEWLSEMMAALPALLDAIDKLPPRQRSAMILTLNRCDIDPDARERLLELAPSSYTDVGPEPIRSDFDIARRLGDDDPHLVRANRCAARRKLAARNPYWRALLDLFMPHRSTRRADQEETRDG